VGGCFGGAEGCEREDCEERGEEALHAVAVGLPPSEVRGHTNVE
jgi:hypothetical protein